MKQMSNFDIVINHLTQLCKALYRYSLYLTLWVSSLLFSQDPFEEALANPIPASTKQLRIPFSDRLNNQTDLPLAFFHGIESGPVFTILAGVHGFEYPPIVAVQQIMQEIDPKKLKGTLVVIPIANKGSFYTRTPFLNPLDKKNLNGVFPGKKDGTVTEKIAAFISTQIIPISDVFLDIHGGDASEDLLPFVCYYENPKYPKQTQKTKALSEASGFENVVSYAFTLEDDEPAKYAFKQACQKGKIALSFESGKLGNVHPEAVERIKNGVYRIMEQLKMYKTATTFPKHPIKRSHNQHYLDAAVQGLFYSALNAGDPVTKGQIVGYITDEFGTSLQELKAPISGFILYKVSTPPVNIDDTLMCISQYL